MEPSKDGAPPVIELRGVQKFYEDGGVQALRGIDLSIRRGEAVAVMGPSGCGKSTLLNIIGALDRPTAGEVIVDGQPLHRLRNWDRIRAHKIGFVFQSFYLLPNLTATENVQIPMFESDWTLAQRIDRAVNLLRLVGLGDRASHLPRQLSIGQRQRVAIARALANEPAILLADEPTGSLDSRTGKEIMELLLSLNRHQGTTLVVVTHDPSVAEYADRRINMLDGRITNQQSVVPPEMREAPPS
ncbi:MAG: ABC transporter ATP-binding protein [Planctomycetota bacterium]|nr:MAG: ABC transporter ATP-binding protein [Planctomycetota bacterium]